VTISFTVEGDPRPKGRPVTRFKDGQPVRTFTPRTTAEWESRVAWAARLAIAGQEPLEGDVAVELHFYRATARRCDFDNLAKAVLDAVQASENSPAGILFADDDQVVEAHIYKAIDREAPRVEVRAWEVEQ